MNIRYQDPTAKFRECDLASGRRLEVHRDGKYDRLIVLDPLGEVELRVRLTRAGPVLEFTAAALAIRTDGDLEIDCEHLRINARTGVDLCTAGNVRQTIHGDLHVTAEGTIEQIGEHIDIHAKPGDLLLRAEREAVLEGARVLINP